MIATIAFWFIFLTGVLLALSTLGIEALNNAIGAVVGYLPNVVAAIIILVVAIAIAGVVGGAIAKLMGDTALGKIAATIVPVLVITVAVFMALHSRRSGPPSARTRSRRRWTTSALRSKAQDPRAPHPRCNERPAWRAPTPGVRLLVGSAPPSRATTGHARRSRVAPGS